MESPLVSPETDARSLAFAPAPASWYYVGSVREVSHRAVRIDLPDQSFAAFRTGEGRFAVLTARCSHMGADLSTGHVSDGRIVCPLHGWEYAPDGKCERIPASSEIPSFACQASYPVQELGGHLFFFNRPRARFPLPFFDGVDAGELRSGRAFDLKDEVPWYRVGGNGFDRQHFDLTHDRRLLAEPAVDTPHIFARRIQLELGISGRSWVDKVTRVLAGRQSRMTVTSWCGTLIFATAQFRRTTTYGLVTVKPGKDWSSHCRVIVWVRRSGNALCRTAIDPLHALIRSRFIKAFFNADLGKLTGTRYQPARMIAADKLLVEYLDWLQRVHR